MRGSSSALVLGDNIFFGHGLSDKLDAANQQLSGGTVFGYQVADPGRYGVLGFDESGRVNSITEKPSRPASNFVVTGLYFLDNSATERARSLKPSERGELEITDLLEHYLQDEQLSLERMGRGYAWLDTGTHGSLLDAGNFIRTLQMRQGVQVGSPDEIAFEQGWITNDEFSKRAELYARTEYGNALRRLMTR